MNSPRGEMRVHRYPFVCEGIEVGIITCRNANSHNADTFPLVHLSSHTTPTLPNRDTN